MQIHDDTGLNNLLLPIDTLMNGGPYMVCTIALPISILIVYSDQNRVLPDFDDLYSRTGNISLLLSRLEKPTGIQGSLE
jgi:uncharacterized protein YpmS